MASKPTGDSGDAPAEPDFAKAFEELAQGERAAAALETHLDSLEQKIEELLAKADEDEKTLKAQSDAATGKPSPGDGAPSR
ncbi:hypothetical protein P280DRAFT_513577 [Massarina eburnea CBS 473.64]|uniref:Uncharacterized protein n=1 Tax=Massarina eburnea CBS 473.64 TaxID=1395130 RepID=A0A6A6SFK0_9PLEO|nr:hypothetical protein P280DRAFT_513577 [Massarina eburnea CBS 473.64]